MKNVEDVYPLSPMQEGMLFDALYEPGSGAYVIQVNSKIQGDCNIPAFQRAWQKILERYPSLRSAFVWDRVERPLQVVRKEVGLTWDQPDWRGLSEEDQESKIKEYLYKERRRGFNFSHAPLMRMALIRLSENLYQFLWSCSHLVVDGWSSNIIFDDLFVYYRAYLENREVSRELPRPYRNFIGWIQQQEKSKAETFWRGDLKGLTAPTILGNETGGTFQNAAEGPDFHQLSASLDSKTTAKLNSLARQHRLTVSTLIQGAWAWLLGYYTRASDVVFGVALTVRPVSLPGADSISGLMVNTLPMRVAISGDKPLLEWLKKLQDHQVEIRKYEYCSLVEVKTWSDITGQLPLFESIVSFQNFPLAKGGQELRGNLRFLSLDVYTGPGYPLTMVIEPLEQMSLIMVFDNRHFTRTVAERILGHFKMLLQEVADNPDQKVRDLTLVTPAERRQLLVEWNDTAANYHGSECVHELFEAQVERTPQAVAVVHEQKQLSYEELNRRANQLAWRLRELGVEPEVRVAICAQRSFEMIVGLLAILKAGGVYVPLDPSYPEERLKCMLTDCAPAALLMQGGLARLVSGIGETLPMLDLSDTSGWADQPEANLKPANTGITSENIAYIIYTSGSTGQPKGVMVPHRAINRLVLNNRHAKFEASDRVAFASNPAFDATTMEVWGPLLNGGSIVVIDQSVLLDASQFGETLKRQAVNILWLTVGLFNQYIDALAEQFSSLRYLIVGGDALDPRVIGRVINSNRPQHLLNGYGPTETTTFAITHEVNAVAENARSIPIGRPIANTRAYILGERGEPMPVGVVGELFIGGAGLARGYLNRADLTAERFVPDPFATEAGARIYKTGDLARWQPDGNIDFVGRNDFQVKIRGFRVELGEIEALLGKHAGVREAVVVAREDTTGDKRLVAYYTCPESSQPGEALVGAEDLRAHLNADLPEYMVPAAYVRLGRMPLTASGKVDRRNLPAPEGDAYAVRGYEAPVGEIETTLAVIWAEVLKVDRVGRYDDFFALGGHSLLATRIVARVKDAFHTDVSLRQLFDTLTIASLSKAIERRLQEETAGLSQSQAQPTIKRVAREAVFVSAED
ncbi:MAG: amino acid adenylation domain-containing protein [Candidatus Sulfotelmatobacter sp.]